MPKIKTKAVRYFFSPLRVMLFLLSITFFSCTTSKYIGNERTPALENNIAFLVFIINKDSVLHKNVVQLTNKIVSAGKVKKNGEVYSPYEDYLTIELFEHGHLASTQIIEHPLSKNVEYEEKDKLITKSLALDKAEFFVRLNLTNNHPEIKISETLKNSTKKELAFFEL